VLVEAALRVLRTGSPEARPAEPSANGVPPDAAGSPSVLDLGTGSGAIAVAIAVEIPAARIVATDVTAAALEVAPRNAAKHGVTGRIEFRQGDLYEVVRADERFDSIVSNPPYCRRRELAGLQPEVREWEPAGALVSGADGMDVTRRIVERAPEFLAPQGWLLIEVGTQADAVRALFEAGAWRDVRCLDDLAGRKRVIAARPRES
jgi:release factor glutamine methyltransferase